MAVKRGEYINIIIWKKWIKGHKAMRGKGEKSFTIKIMIFIAIYIILGSFILYGIFWGKYD